MNIRERLLSRAIIDPDTGCWNWSGYRLYNGYGRIGDNSVVYYTHRVAYELWYGPIPTDLTIDHLCRNRGCCNPAHLEAVTQQINGLRSPTSPTAINSRKTHCIRGHQFDLANTKVRHGRSGRECRTCANARRRKERVA